MVIKKGMIKVKRLCVGSAEVGTILWLIYCVIPMRIGRM